jgi:lipoprotein-releasing system permease protein
MMRQPYPAAIALRYLGARSQSAFISFISAVSMLGVALAVAVLIIVMAVVNGFESELERRILSVSPDARIYGHANGGSAPVDDWQALRALALERDDVTGAAPFVEGQGLVHVGAKLLGVTVRGVDPALESTVSSIGEHLVAGSFDSLREKWHIVIGRTLAEDLGVTVGDEVLLHLPRIIVTAVGPSAPVRAFTIGGIFDVGMAEFDRGLVLVSFEDATKLYRTGGKASGISIRVDDVYEARTIIAELAYSARDRFKSAYEYEDWSYRHANVFRSIELTRPILFIMLSLVIAIAAFNIVSTLFMVVREKRGDIAILRSLGAAPRHILGIFVAQGSSIGFLGMLGGLALGLALVASLGTIVDWIERIFSIDLLSADVYLIGDLPTEARAGDVLRICLLAVGLAVLATLYPAWRAARQPPAEALRNE